MVACGTSSTSGTSLANTFTVDIRNDNNKKFVRFDEKDIEQNLKCLQIRNQRSFGNWKLNEQDCRAT